MVSFYSDLNKYDDRSYLKHCVYMQKNTFLRKKVPDSGVKKYYWKNFGVGALQSII